MSERIELFATSPKGLTDLLANEIRTVGGKDVRARPGGIRFRGPLATAYRVCLWSRIANRVLMPLTRFDADTPEALYEGVAAFPWQEHLAATGTLAIECQSVQSEIDHTHYASLKTKDAIVDQFRARTGRRPSVDRESPDLRVNVYLYRNRVTVSLDLGGTSLHRRGYRQASGPAPLKENLAAGMLLFAGWEELARENAPFLDPMCGSGTVLIEAACIAADIAPALRRTRQGFEGWLGHRPEVWAALIEEAAERAERGKQTTPLIIGFDADHRAVETAHANVRAAGLEGRIRVEQCAVQQARAPASLGAAGLVAFNPPYGTRLGETESNARLYRETAERLRTEFAGWRLTVLQADAEDAPRLDLVELESRKVFNGPIACRIVSYRIDDAVRAERGAVDDPHAEQLANRLRKNHRHLGRWARRQGISCYRVYDADLPEYAFAIDLYENGTRWALVQEYDPPASVDAGRAAARRAAALRTTTEVLAVPEARTVFKSRRRQRGRDQYSRLDERGEYLEVSEGECRLLVNLTDYLDTGLFLDHRPTRQLIARLAKGGRFLNLFAYTGAATVHAALGGATETLSVDLSRTYVQWGERNFRLNGLDPTRHVYERADCLAWLDEARSGRSPHGPFELIFIDAPTFSNSKRMSRDFDVQRDHAALIQSAAALLTDDGCLIFSNHLRGFRMEESALTGLSIENLTRQTIDRDFERRSNIHGCWKIGRAD